MSRARLTSLIALALLALVLPILVRAQDKPAPSQEKATSDREIDVDLWQSVIGTTSVTGLLVGQTIYIQPLDVFNFVKIRADVSPDGSAITGYYIEETRKYSIDSKARTVTYQEKTWKLSPEEYIVRSTGGYLRADMFEKVFNLKAVFEFRGLSVELKSGEPLPAESEEKYAKQRKNAGGFSEHHEKPERTLPLKRSWFSLGAVDYSGGYSYTQGQRPGDLPIQYSLLGGGQLLGGDFDVAIASQSRERIDWQNAPWEWRFSVQNSSMLSKILVGPQIAPSNSISASANTAARSIGVQLTNASNEQQSSFSNYTISDRTEPDWTVELYINEALVNFTKADQTGFYKFVIPLTYGTTNIKLKFYGPFGEVRTNTVNLQIPYTFLPPGHLEYTLTSGTPMDHPNIKQSTSQLDLKLGISTALTLVGGMRYVRDSVLGTSYTPYGSTSLRIFSGLLVGGEYYYNSGYRGTLSLSGPAGLSIEGEYDKPIQGLWGTPDPLHANLPASEAFRVLDQRKLAISSPLPFSAGSLRMSATDVPMNKDSSNFALTSEMLVNLFGASMNISANSTYLRDRLRLIGLGEVTGEAGLSFTVLSGTAIRPSCSMNYTTRKLTSGQMGITKSFGDWLNLSLTGSHSFSGTGNSVQLSLRTMLPLLQVGISSGTGTGQPVTGSTTVQGSLGFDAGVGFYGGNRPQVRRGGVEIVPFIDQNENGKWDRGEPLVPHFGLEQAPGRVITGDDGMLTVMDLEPYKHYFVKTSTAELENISLIPAFKSFEVTPPANGFVRIEIPLASAGQIEGYVMSRTGAKEEGQGGARLKVRRWEIGRDTSEIALTEDLLSYSNGEFYYMGLTPGTYRISIDPVQLRILNASCTPPFIEFVIKSKEDGDVINGLNFSLTKQAHPTAPRQAER